MSERNKKVLVTGGAGFIGSHMCEALLGKDWEVTCLDDFRTGAWENIKHLAGLQVIEGNANDGEVMKKVGESEFDVVYHYAATVGVRRTEENPSAVLEDVLGMRHVAELAKVGRFQKVIFASSSEVYGEPKSLPEKEEEGVIGWSPYTAVKLYGEHLFSSLWREYKIPTVSLRFFNVYGQRQIGSAYGFVTARFVEQVLAGKEPTVFGDGKQTRDFVYIGDNIRAGIAASEREEAWGEVINVGSGVETEIRKLAQVIVEKGSNGAAGGPLYLPARKVDVRRRCAAVKKMQALLGVACDLPLEKGIDLTLAMKEERIELPKKLELAAQEAA